MVLTRLLHGKEKDERGVFAVIFAMLAIALFVVAAMVVDLGNARAERRSAQNAADASALAGGNVLFPVNALLPDYTGAANAAKAYALRNYGVTASQWSTCTDPDRLITLVGGQQCISFQVTANLAYVRVKIPEKTIQTVFAGAAGVSQLKVNSSARATLTRGGASQCGLCILGPGLHNLQNGDAFVNGADVHFNGNVSVSSNGLIVTNGAITVEGTADGPLSNYTPDPSTGAPRINDPLADYQDRPVYSSLIAKSNPCGLGSTHGPGIYGDMDLRNDLCLLQPGLYVIVGTWDMAGNASTIISGTGVTLFFTCGTTSAVRACNAGESGGTLDHSGNGQLSITAPLVDPYKGMALWYDRRNAATIRMTGNGASTYTGTLYAPAATIQMNGNGCTNPINALIIVSDIEMNGNPACLRSNYTQNLNVQIPPGELHLDR